MAERGEPIDPIVPEVAKDPGQNSTAVHASDTSSSTSDSQYTIELRAPRKGNKKKKPNKRFKLVLRDSSSSESELDESMSVNIAPQQPRLDNIKEVIQSHKEDSCTQDNWKAFFSYRKREKNGVLVNSNQAEFERKQTPTSSSLSLVKSSEHGIELEIKSSYLQKQLRKVVDIENYNGVSLSSTAIHIKGDFIPLYHHIDDMRSNVTADNEATAADRAHMDALYYFSTVGWPAKSYADARNIISQGLITSNTLWALFRPGDFVVYKSTFGPIIRKISSVKREKESSITYRWRIVLHDILWTGYQFKERSTQKTIKGFDGARKITDLDFYPLSRHESGEELREAAIQRGKLWKEYCQGDPRVMSYEGRALAVLIEPELAGPPHGENHDNAFNLLSTVIVDGDSTSKTATQAAIDEMSLVFNLTYDEKSTTVSNFTDEEFMICPKTLEVFSLDNQDWYQIEVNGLKPKKWRPESFGRLVLDQDKKDNIIRLATANSRTVQEAKSRDIIEGKGKGIVFLLHGPPGVGKTLTAEVLSEYTERPLLKVNLGRVANHLKWEQSLEQIFLNAEAWKAILLIDEAEIVLEKRTFERMTQNSWISVFLRKLEYYKGILILTTNLIHCIDEAFESRISYPIQFCDLSRKNRHQIWSGFIKEMLMLPAYKKTLMNEVDRWSEAEINGRQIRNIILMAENLAASDENHPRLLPKHIDEMLDVTLEFCDYNRESSARVKKFQLAGPSY